MASASTEPDVVNPPAPRQGARVGILPQTDSLAGSIVSDDDGERVEELDDVELVAVERAGTRGM